MYTVRVATQQDLDTITPYAFQFWNETTTYSQRAFNIDIVKQHLSSLIDGAGCLFLCVNEHDEPVGAFAGGFNTEWQSGDMYTFDYFLFVRPEYRGSRAAVLLINTFIDWSKRMGCKHIMCGTATGIDPAKTIRFYEHFGFKQTGVFLEQYI